MSNAALTWAFSVSLKPSARKFLLVALADAADDAGECWPSIPALMQKTDQDRKTVIAGLEDLQQRGFIIDTGQRKGQTKQIPVYRVNWQAGNSPKNGTVPDFLEGETAESGSTEKRNSSKNGTVSGADSGVSDAEKRNSTENGIVPDFPANSPVFPQEQSRFSHETVPFLGHGTLSNPNGTQKEPTVIVDADASETLNGPAGSGSKRRTSKPETGTASTRLPADWMPRAEDIARMSEECPGLDLRRATANFVDYWAALPETRDKKAYKADWNATWRNNMRDCFDKGRYCNTAQLPGPQPKDITAPRNGNPRPVNGGSRLTAEQASTNTNQAWIDLVENGDTL